VSAAIVTLASLERVLDSGANVASMYDQAQRRQKSRDVLQDSVLELLANGRALRPKDIAEQLDTGPSQISRVLRRLLESGAVTKSNQASRDGRANWYTRVETAGAAA
jgi:DNA-binding MarR family transcriptional regulator